MQTRRRPACRRRCTPILTLRLTCIPTYRIVLTPARMPSCSTDARAYRPIDRRSPDPVCDELLGELQGNER